VVVVVAIVTTTTTTIMIMKDYQKMVHTLLAVIYIANLSSSVF
jgi:hypothetical protein